MNHKKQYYNKVSANPNFPEIELEILKYWDEENIFQKSVEQNKEQEFIFFDGPPFANGLPHYGHLLSGFIKDVYARYQTIKGKRVERRFGWDCHGLPAEMQSEKELGFSGRIAITEFGIDKFNEHCRQSVMKYTKEWEEYVNRQARWVDFKNDYKTMDINFMESVLWVFKELYNKGLIYQSMRVMPYSWACETPLSNFETRLDNSYRQRADKTVTCSFIINDDLKISDCNEYRILAWTTTPWTLPSNLALAVSESIDYALVKKDKTCYIIGKFALEKYSKELNIDPNNVTEIIKGKDLEGLSYKPLFNYFENNPNSFKILTASFVEEGDGTGVVHIAPGFGEDDLELCNKNNIPLVCPVDNSGKFTSEVPDLQGIQVFDANDKIIIKLKEDGNWIKTEQYLHNYPHCWRTDTPLIYKAMPSWYVKVTAIRERMCELNQQINWIPENVKDGLFGKWLEGAKDWSISRKRFWGTPIPVWISDDPKYPRIDVYGSIKELEQDFNTKITDLHRPFIDSLIRSNPDDPTGKSMMRRVEDVFDCWFESGSMPYGQAHYPFENKESFHKNFPADFIVEYTAQTRGWFYTLMVLSTALFDSIPFKNCICHGVVLDINGQKLSKRLNNYANPLELFKLYGADSLRATMLASTVVKGQELLIDKDAKVVYETLRLFIKPIWNAFYFFNLYANADGLYGENCLIDMAKPKLHFSFNENQEIQFNFLDYYILAKLKNAIDNIEKSLDSFDTQIAYKIVGDFFDVLNNWYIRRNRNRFWKSEIDQDKQDAYNVLYTCLSAMCRAMSPLLPLISESIYLSLNNNSKSVHLEYLPKLPDLTNWYIGDTNLKYDITYIDKMDKLRDICSNVLFLRTNSQIRIRQPLNKVTLISKDINLSEFEQEIIKDEVNVKEIIIDNNLEKYAKFKLSINFPILGKRLPNKVKNIIQEMKLNNWEKEEENLKIAGELLNSEEFSIILEPNKELSGATALSNNLGIVILDLQVTDALKEEGIARDLIRLIQQARKDANFNISDKIQIDIKSNNDIEIVMKNFKDMILEQTLGEFIDINNPDYSTQADLNENSKVIINLKKLN